jgi:Ni/Fe-hydrogenase subunit HybB-like protein
MAILLLAGLRRGYRLERYIKPEHFDMLSKILLGMSLVMTFTYCTEFFMAFFRGTEAEAEMFRWRPTGAYAWVFWLVIGCNSVVPLACFWGRVRRSLPALVAISALVTIGMWFERFLFIVTTLAHHYLPQNWGHYAPTVPEVLICLGGFGWFVMLFLLFIKIFPCMSVAETMERQHAAAHDEQAQVSYG